MKMVNTNDELTREEIELVEAAKAGKGETKRKLILATFGGTVRVSPTRSGKLCVRVDDIRTNIQPVGSDKYNALEALTAACVLLSQILPDSSDEQKEFLLETLHDLILGDEEDGDEIVGNLICAAIKPTSALAYKTAVEKRNE